MRNSRLSRSSLSGNHSPQASRWSVALGILLLAGQLACGSTPGESDIKKDNDTNILNDHIDLPGNNTDDIVQLATAKQLISDPNFTNGFITQDPTSGADVGRITPSFSRGTPVWRLGQWGRANNLGVLNNFSYVGGSSEHWDDFKGSVTIGAPGSGAADLSLRVNAYEEYQGNYYPYAGSRSTWVHLIAEQGLTPLTDYPDEGCPALSRLSSLNFSVDARLLYDNANRRSGYDAGKHAADYYVYFTIQNRNAAKAAGYGDYLWFGLVLYGDRDPSPGLYVNGDDFTQKLIYNIGYEPLADKDLTDGTWRHLQEDLLPHMKSALQAAWDRGYLPDSRNMGDYRIGGMNIGWEIPGLNHVDLEIKNLSLIAATGAPTQPVAPNPPSVPVDADSIVYTFNQDGNREGWTTRNIDDVNNGPRGGLWTMTVPSTDPGWISPALSINAANFSSLSLNVANAGNPADGSVMQVFWNTGAGFSEANSAVVSVANHGGWGTYTINLSAHPNWNGTITQLRIDPILYGDGHAIGVDSIILASNGGTTPANPVDPVAPVDPVDPVDPAPSTPPASSVAYTFNTNGNREGWTTANINDGFGGPQNGMWIMTVPGSDPTWNSPAMSVNTASYSKISIKMANDHNPAGGSAMQVFWSNGGDFSEANSAWTEVSYQGGWVTYTINLAGKPGWSGTVSKIRIDPIMYGDGHAIGVDSIILTP